MDVQVLSALTDLTEENGASRLVPGSDRRDRMPAPDEDVRRSAR
jgi:ectoine hydroxylase-related dioxygenase (phytanoyl-CoA dioxygenase family)